MKNFTGIVTVVIFLSSFSAFSQTYSPMGIDDPVITIEDVITPVTTCPANGSIAVTATIEGNPLSADSEFQWFVGTQSAPSDAFEEGVDGDITGEDNSTSQISHVKPGPYTLIVRDGEVYSEPKTFIVGNNAISPAALEVEVLHQNCAIPGSIEVTGISPGDPEDYTYTWYQGSVSEANRIEGESGSLLLYEDAGTYYVVASHPESGCTSEAKEAVIQDLSTTPEIAFVSTAKTSCTVNNGALEVTATPEGEYNFSWFVGSGTEIPYEGVPVDNGNNSKIAHVGPGKYTVTAMNNTTGCQVTATAEVKDETGPSPTLTVSASPQDICRPSGSIEVTGVSEGERSGYTYAWYRESVAPSQLISGVNGLVLNNGNYPDIGAGTYYVVATDLESGCSSNPRQAIIEDLSADPVITFVQTANTSCDKGNGSLEATAMPEGDYTFSWFVGSGTTTPLDGTATGSGNKSRIENVEAGDYTVKATSIASGCEITRTYTVDNNSGAPEIGDVAITHQDLCSPSGSIAVTTLSEGDPSGYVFTWYRVSPVPENLITGVTGAVLNNDNYPEIGAGTYYVVATAAGSGCASSPREVIIEDAAEAPELTLTENEGSITAEVTSQGTFTFEWFAGTDIPFQEGTHGSITTSENISTIDNMAPGMYTVRVTNEASGCTSTKSYLLQGDTENPQVESITSGESDPTNQSPVTVQVSFSEPMLDPFHLEKAVIQNGTAKNLKRVNDNTFSFEVTPASDGEVTVAVPAGIAYDREDNPNEAAGEIFRIVYDGTAPEVTINAGVSGVTDVSPVSLTIVFSEAVNSFGEEDIETTNADLSGFTKVSNAEYRASLMPLAPGNVTIFIAGGAALDAAGNPNTEGSFQFAFEKADSTKVAFAGPGHQTIPRSEGTFTLEVMLTDPDPLQPTTVEVALTQGDPVAIEDYVTQTLTFAAGSDKSQFVPVNISGDYQGEETETFVFSLKNISGGYKATAGEADTVAVTITYDDITGLEPEIIAGIDIFPNPVARYLLVNLDKTMVPEAIQVMIYDIYGQQVMARQLSEGNNRIHVGGLRNGIYMVYVFNGDRVMVQKIQVLK